MDERKKSELGREMGKTFRAMGEIERVMAEALDGDIPFENLMEVYGRKAGEALREWNEGQGHQPGWVSKKAYDVFRDKTWPFMRGLNKALGLPEDTLA